MKTEDKKIDAILTKQEQKDLLYLLKDSSWESVGKIAKVMQDDWTDQTMKVDYRTLTDDVAVKDLISKQGMIRGIDSLFFYLKRWRERIEKEAEKRDVQ